jgi:hypothetical protein
MGMRPNAPGMALAAWKMWVVAGLGWMAWPGVAVHVVDVKLAGAAGAPVTTVSVDLMPSGHAWGGVALTDVLVWNDLRYGRSEVHPLTSDQAIVWCARHRAHGCRAVRALDDATTMVFFGTHGHTSSQEVLKLCEGPDECSARLLMFNLSSGAEWVGIRHDAAAVDVSLEPDLGRTVRRDGVTYQYVGDARTIYATVQQLRGHGVLGMPVASALGPPPQEPPEEDTATTVWWLFVSAAALVVMVCDEWTRTRLFVLFHRLRRVLLPRKQAIAS